MGGIYYRENNYPPKVVDYYDEDKLNNTSSSSNNVNSSTGSNGSNGSNGSTRVSSPVVPPNKKYVLLQFVIFFLI